MYNKNKKKKNSISMKIYYIIKHNNGNIQLLTDANFNKANRRTH